MVQVVLLLAALTDPPLDVVPVDQQVVTSLPSSSWRVADENVLVGLATEALKPPSV
jgi:hypothetical protein